MADMSRKRKDLGFWLLFIEMAGMFLILTGAFGQIFDRKIASIQTQLDFLGVHGEITKVENEQHRITHLLLTTSDDVSILKVWTLCADARLGSGVPIDKACDLYRAESAKYEKLSSTVRSQTIPADGPVLNTQLPDDWSQDGSKLMFILGTFLLLIAKFIERTYITLPGFYRARERDQANSARHSSRSQFLRRSYRPPFAQADTST